ncbi:MAG: DUF799 family lipoprotein [Magnetococcales bacterium]|nr:DUF799 family lipoprotein [Magnetococcales bacterium]
MEVTLGAGKGGSSSRRGNGRGIALALLAGGAAVLSGCVADGVMDKIKGGEPEVASDLPSRVAVLPFRNSASDPQASEITRRLFFNFFSALNYHDVEISTVDRVLKEKRLTEAMLQWEDARLALACQALGVDGVIRGEVTDYGKVYAVLYTHRQVGMKTELVRCRDGKKMWAKEDVLTEREGGMALDLTGLAMAVIKNLVSYNTSNTMQTAVGLCMRMAGEVPNPPQLSDPPPKITLLAHNGVEKFLTPGEKLKAVLLGDPGQSARWTPAPGLEERPMEEKSRGVYAGEYTVQEGDRRVGALPVATLIGKSGSVNQWLDVLGGVNLGRPTALPQLLEENRTLTAAQSPYLIDQVLVVKAGATLTVEPGVVLWVQGKGIVIKGGLEIRGTAEDPVRLLGFGGGERWLGVLVDQAAQPVTLEHFQISGAQTGIKARKSNVTVRHGLIRDNGYGVVAEGGSLDLRESLIRDSEKVGLALKETAGQVSRTLILENRGGGVQVKEAAITLQGNDLYGNGPWELRNDGAAPFQAGGNWWGQGEADKTSVQGEVVLKPMLTQSALKKEAGK